MPWPHSLGALDIGLVGAHHATCVPHDDGIHLTQLASLVLQAGAQLWAQLVVLQAWQPSQQSPKKQKADTKK